VLDRRTSTLKTPFFGKCQRFLKLSAEERLRAVLINKYCAKCLAHEHSTESCRSGDRCKTSDRNLHTLFHMHEHASRKSSGSQQQAAFAPPRSANSPNAWPSLRSASSTPAPSLAELLQHHSFNVLPTAMVIVETGEKSFLTAALIDPCTPTSFIFIIHPWPPRFVCRQPTWKVRASARRQFGRRSTRRSS